MKLALEKLDWYKFLNYASQFLFSEKAKEEFKSFAPPYEKFQAGILQRETLFVLELFKKKIEFSFPELNSIEKLFFKQKKRGFFLPAELARFKPWFISVRIILPYLENSPFLRLKEVFSEVDFLEERLEEVINCEAGEVRDRASFQLYAIRRRIRELQENLWKRLEVIKDRLFKKGYLREPIITQRAERYVLPVKIEYKNKVRGILHEVSSSGATAFIEPAEIISLANDLEELKWQEEREIIKILKELTGEFEEKEAYFLEMEKEFMRFEFALARAQLGREYNGIMPVLKDGEIYFKEAIHPLLYLAYKENKGRRPVANDFLIKKGLLISGPNLGGKTVSLKTIGLLSLMAQSGFLVPARKAEVPVFNKVFVDLGDEQDLLEGESSFSSHLKNLKKIVENADENSLVLLDEPGKGTNPEEGSALVAGIVSVLLERGSKVVITTHSQQLKLFAVKLSGLELASMEYDTERLEPLYKLSYGRWGESFAFELARKIGISEEVLKRAEAFLKDKEYWQLTRVIAREREKLKKHEESLKELEEALKKKEEKLLSEKEELEKEKREKVRELIEEYREKMNSLLKQVQTSPKSEKKLREKLSRLSQEFSERMLLEKQSQEHFLREGDRVFIPGLGIQGEIVRIKGKICEIKAGNLKLEVEKERIKKVEEAKPKKKSRNTFKISSSERIFEKESTRIELLGLTVEEAISEVERALNRAFLEGKKKVLLVHGHGTGKLREAIRRHLTGHPLVEKFEYAPPHEGGTGVTVVYMATLI